MSYDTPLSAQGQQLTNLPLKDQLRRGFRDMGSRSYSSARNFGLIGAMFAGTECCIESVCCAFQRRIGRWTRLTLYAVSRKKRLEEWRFCWLRYWRCSGREGWAAGSCSRLRRICCFQRSHRRLHASTD